MKSKKILLVLSFLIILMFVCFFFRNYSIYGNKLKDIKINGNKLKVETANSSEKLARGLGGRNSLCDKCGMLFEFSEKGRHSFWMKGMRFNLDIIWIDGDEIVYIVRNVSYNSSETITPEVKADRVLEVSAGISDRLNIEAGDMIEF